MALGAASRRHVAAHGVANRRRDPFRRAGTSTSGAPTGPAAGALGVQGSGADDGAVLDDRLGGGQRRAGGSVLEGDVVDDVVGPVRAPDRGGAVRRQWSEAGSVGVAPLE